MSYLYKLTFEKSVEYLRKELNFIENNYNFFASIWRKLSFFAHIIYWQGLFKLYRSLNIALKKITNRPFYIHKNKIEIEITTKCNMKCYHCNRSCMQAQSDEHMDIEQIKYFIDESVKTNKKWPFIVLIGGEPTLHPDIYTICELFIDYKLKHSPNTKLTISTNGASEETKEILANLPDIIHQENTNKKSNINTQFYSFNMAPIDTEKFTSSDTDFSIGCITATLSGSALTRYGYYPCGAAASIDRVLGLNIGIKNLSDITEKKFRSQLGKLCGYCGLFDPDNNKSEDLKKISKTWQVLYENYSKQKPGLTLYGNNYNLTDKENIKTKLTDKLPEIYFSDNLVPAYKKQSIGENNKK